MCLLLLAFGQHPRYRLVVGANRDEFYDRPTSAAGFWVDAPGVLAGRDLREGGTWLGITREGRFAALTNFRDSGSTRSEGPSRGHLVGRFLLGDEPPDAYLARVARNRDQYNGFSLITYSGDALCYYSNREKRVRVLPPGVYGLSNHLLDTPWPKVTRGKQVMTELLAEADRLIPEALFDLLADRNVAGDQELPATGVGIDQERWLSSLFVSSAVYGTRSSTVVLLDRQGEVTFLERTFNRDPDSFTTVAHTFRLSPVGDRGSPTS
jgi:uncharacterized protein with NRDE domain